MTEALVRINNGLALVEQRRTDVERWQKANLKLYQTGGGRTTYNSGAREAGRRAGASISLNAGGRRLGGQKAIG